MALARIVLSLIAVAYPLVVYGGLRVLEPRTLALSVAVFLLVRGVLRYRRSGQRDIGWLVLPLATIVLLVVLAGLFNEGRFLLFTPVLINGTLLVTFARTLVSGPSMVESLARFQYGRLDAEAVLYCRQVTRIWCVFFFLNGGFIFWLAVYGTLEQWTVYTGGVAYVLVGMLFAAEFTYRSWRFRRYEGNLLDPLFRRIFPPRQSP